jgi:DNA-binding GntR family transcriptional regulator
VTDSPFIRSNLREQIKDVILQRILDGDYEPGARLVETRIAQELGVSQAPVREALRDLEQLGCIVHEPFRGCSVRAFSARELLEAFPVRAALEALAALEDVHERRRHLRHAAVGAVAHPLLEGAVRRQARREAHRRAPDAHDVAVAQLGRRHQPLPVEQRHGAYLGDEREAAAVEAHLGVVARHLGLLEEDARGHVAADVVLLAQAVEAVAARVAQVPLVRVPRLVRRLDVGELRRPELHGVAEVEDAPFLLQVGAVDGQGDVRRPTADDDAPVALDDDERVESREPLVADAPPRLGAAADGKHAGSQRARLLSEFDVRHPSA